MSQVPGGRGDLAPPAPDPSTSSSGTGVSYSETWEHALRAHDFQGRLIRNGAKSSGALVFEHAVPAVTVTTGCRFVTSERGSWPVSCTTQTETTLRV